MCIRDSLGHHLDSPDGADGGADLAALAEVVVEADEGCVLDQDCRVWAVKPAEQAVGALREVGERLDAGAPTPGFGLLCVGGPDRAPRRELLPGLRARHAYPSAIAPRSE